MKLLVEVLDLNKTYLNCVDGVILPLEHFSVESIKTFTLDEIEDFISNTNIEVFVKMNKNFMNEDIDSLKEVLLRLNKLRVKGILFYDLAVLQLKKELNLDIDLVWNQTHMVNNYETCNYYNKHGVKYALIGKEITLDEIVEILNKSSILSIVEVVSKPSVAFSKRNLVKHYYQNLGKSPKSELLIKEKNTNTNYQLIEDENGTSFYLDVITNGTGVIKDLFDNNCPYILMKEYGLEDIFEGLVLDTMNYINGNCLDKNYIDRYKVIGDSTNFFFRKTIYRVKKNG